MHWVSEGRRSCSPALVSQLIFPSGVQTQFVLWNGVIANNGKKGREVEEVGQCVKTILYSHLKYLLHVLLMNMEGHPLVLVSTGRGSLLPPPLCLKNWRHSLALCQQTIWYVTKFDFLQFLHVVLQLLLRKTDDVFSLHIPHWAAWERVHVHLTWGIYVFCVILCPWMQFSLPVKDGQWV